MRSLAAPQRNFDIALATRFVTALTGRSDTPLVFQFIDDTAAQRKELSRVHVGSLAQLSDLIAKMNNAAVAIFMQVNAGRRGKANVTAARACFVDDDGTSPLPPILRVPPSITVASSEGKRNRHYYWLLREGQSLERWAQVQRHLALYYSTDKSMTNLDRVMRLPGTWNMHGPCAVPTCAKCKKRPRTRPEQVQLLSTADYRYTYDEILAAHPLPVAAEAEALAQSAPSEAPTEAARLMANRIGYWLTTKGIECDIINPTTFRLRRCVFNPSHLNKLMIRVQSRGGIWAGCWHDSCGGNVNRWSAIKDKVGGWGKDSAPFARGDDVEIAQRLLTDITGHSEEPLVSDLGGLWKYQPDTGLWQSIDRSYMAQTVAAYAGSKVGGKRQLHVSRGDIEGAISVANDLAAQPGFFGEAPPGVAFTNGVLIATPNGTAFVPHAPENRLLLGLPYAYDESAKCDRWRNYLADAFEGDEDAPAKIDLLQEFLGACLIGIATRYQKALLLYGMQGDNGKSVYTYVASALFPKEVRRSIKPQDWGREYYAAELATARVNIVSEVPETDILSGDTFKAMVSGDAIHGRQPHGRTFQFTPMAGNIFACNRLPGTADHTNAFWKRFVIVEWNRSFPMGHPLRDDTLRETIAATEMPGIAAWAIAGASRLLAQGALTVPQSHFKLLQGWKTDVDSVAAFLAECCDMTEEPNSTVRHLYPYFKSWCGEAGRKAIADSTFARRLTENKIPTRMLNGYKYYSVRIKESVIAHTPPVYLTE